MQCYSLLDTEENSDVVILQVFANLLVDHDLLNQVFVVKSVQKNTGFEGLAWNPPWLNAQYCIIECRGHSTQLTEWWGAGIQVHQTQGDMKATSDSDMQQLSGLRGYSGWPQTNFIPVLGLHRKSHDCCGNYVELSDSRRVNFEDA